MMISGFEWERFIARANMGAGITRQMLRYCREILIPKLEERRYWAEAFNILNAQNTPMAQQDLQDVHFFERLARKWKFVRDAEKRVWRLYFVAMIAPPEADADAIEPDGGEGGPVDGANRRTMRPNDGLEERPAARVAVEPPRTHEIVHGICRYQLRASWHLLRRTSIAAHWVAEDALERLGDNLKHLTATLHLHRHRTAESLTALVREMRLAVACAPRRLAQLGFVEFRFGAHQTLSLPAFRPEEPNWNDWLFGRLIDEDLATP